MNIVLENLTAIIDLASAGKKNPVISYALFHAIEELADATVNEIENLGLDEVEA